MTRNKRRRIIDETGRTLVIAFAAAVVIDTRHLPADLVYRALAEAVDDTYGHDR